MFFFFQVVGNQIFCDFTKFLLILKFKIVYLFSGGRECGFPGTPRNGSLVESAGLLYQIGENVTYECQMSFVLFGPNYRTCQENGTWSGTVPECRKFLHIGIKLWKIKINFRELLFKFSLHSFFHTSYTIFVNILCKKKSCIFLKYCEFCIFMFSRKNSRLVGFTFLMNKSLFFHITTNIIK